MVPTQSPLIPILCGTTAAGKTRIAIACAARFSNIEIINADSLLVYRGFDIGTAKPTEAERAGVPHHLIDIRDPDQLYTAADFTRDATQALEQISARGKRALIVGGTGFYLKALLFGLWEAPATDLAFRQTLESIETRALWDRLLKLDQPAALKIGAGDRYRLIRALEILQAGGQAPSRLDQTPREPDPRLRLLWIDREDAELSARIAERTRLMLDAGLEREVTELRAHHPESRALTSVGYAQVVAYQNGIAPEGRKLAPGRAGLQSEIELATRQLVKSQRTWFKGQLQARAPESCQSFILDRDEPALLQALETLLK